MLLDLRMTVPGLLVAIGCVLLVTVRAATAAGPVPKRHATAPEREELAMKILQSESDWFVETSKNFPYDNWSQRDDFHGREFKKAVELAKEKDIRLEDVLRLIDDDIHRRKAKSPDASDQRSARAMPCKPRPFYD